MREGGKSGGLVLFGQVDLQVLLIPLGPFYIGWVLASQRLLPTDWTFYLGLLAIFPFLGIGTVLLNDAFDVDVDRLSRRKGRFASSRGEVDRGRLVFLAAISLVASIVLAVVAATDFGLVIILLVGLTALYSFPPINLSRRPGLDLFANMLGIGVFCTIGGWVLGTPEGLPPAAWLITSALGTGTFFLLPALMDYESDKAGGKRTVAVSLGWVGACGLGTTLISMADVGIVYMSLSSIILKPPFLLIAWPIILGEVIIFPVLARRREMLRTLTGAMGTLLFIGNLLIVLSYLDMLGPF
jgi:4-hydroxybenzoate polyprenyltransferase